ncbi:MAG: lytic transglycosylase domain-containing protein [Oscillospiraceae bacterium]
MVRKHKKIIKFLIVAIVLAIAILVAQMAYNYFIKISYPQKYADTVNKYSDMYNVDTNLIFAIIRTESGFKADAKSGAGAIGLMQMTEETFDWIKKKIAPEEELAFEDLYTPETSIRFGAYYISICLEKYGGDISTAAASYHSGWGTVGKLLGNAEYSENGQTLNVFPYEQMNLYVKKVQKSYIKYNEIYTVKV